MRTSRWLIVVVVAVISGGTLFAPSPASAAYGGPEWSARWYYTSATELTLFMSTPLGDLTGRVTEGAAGRTYQVTVTDARNGDGYCPQLQVAGWLGGPAVASVAGCDGSHSITLDQAGELFFYLCGNFHGPPGAGDECNRLRVPVVAPELRAYGTGLSWAYSTAPGQEHLFSWWAVMPGLRAYGDGTFGLSSGYVSKSVGGYLNTTENAAPECGAIDLTGSGSTSTSVNTCEQDSFVLTPVYASTQSFTLLLCRWRAPWFESCISGWLA